MTQIIRCVEVGSAMAWISRSSSILGGCSTYCNLKGTEELLRVSHGGGYA